MHRRCREQVGRELETRKYAAHTRCTRSGEQLERSAALSPPTIAERRIASPLPNTACVSKSCFFILAGWGASSRHASMLRIRVARDRANGLNVLSRSPRQRSLKGESRLPCQTTYRKIGRFFILADHLFPTPAEHFKRDLFGIFPQSVSCSSLLQLRAILQKSARKCLR